MATISSAILCDFAQVREGLLFVASGALTRIFRPSLPAPLGVMVGVVVELDFDEVGATHELVVAVKEAATAHQVGRIQATLHAGASELEPGESLYVPIPVSLHGIELRSYGPHDVQVSVDGGVSTSLTFYVGARAQGAVGLGDGS